MLLRSNAAGSLLRIGQSLELQLRRVSIDRFAEFLNVLPSHNELDECRTLLLNFTYLHVAYPSTAAVLVAWFHSHEKRLEANAVEVDYDPPEDDSTERWLEAVGFTFRVLNGDVRPRDTQRTMVLHEIEPGATTAPYTVAADVDSLISRNRLPIAKESLGSLFGALSEVVENILRHARMTSPAFACAQVHPSTCKFSFCVADPGIGLYESFRTAPYLPARVRINSGASPLDLAIEPLMSSKYGMGHSGYGLFYASELCAMSSGTFSITSGCDSLVIYPNGRYRKTHAHWHGTIIQFLLDTRNVIDGSSVWAKLPDLNEDEPRIGYVDYSGSDCFRMRQFGERLLTRDAGGHALAKALQHVDDGLLVSLEDIQVMTPSFADEFFGGLFSQLGPHRFRDHVSMVRPDEYSQSLIEMVLKHRMERA